MTRPLRAHAELVPPTPVDVPVTTSIGAHGEAVTLWADAAGRAALVNGAPGPPVPVWVTVQRQYTMMNTVRIEALPLTSPQVQRLPDGQVLVVGRGQPNALVFGATGELVRAGHVGDGVTHVAATPGGNVWVANADGLVRFAADLTPQCSLSRAAGVFTLNVHGETAWACHQPDSPIVRVAGDVLTSWNNRVSGSAAMLVGADAVALVGEARIVVGQLTGSAFEPVTEVGVALPADAQLFGRDDVLHVFAGTAWYRLDLDDIM
jgi:hypothetical protein